MRFRVFRYLSKPLEKQRLFRNLKDAVDLYNTITIKLPVETRQGVHTLPASSVIAIEAQGRKVIVHTALRDYESVHNMQYWAELLPQNMFFRTHRSFIINFEHVTDFDHTLIHLADNQFHPSSTSLFCNLLENAIEAACNAQNPFIEITTSNRDKTPFALITLINSCGQNPLTGQSPNLITTKPDKQKHGFGIKSIRKIVKKYHGDIQMYYNEESLTFHTIITLRKG